MDRDPKWKGPLFGTLDSVYSFYLKRKAPHAHSERH